MLNNYYITKFDELCVENTYKYVIYRIKSRSKRKKGGSLMLQRPSISYFHKSSLKKSKWNKVSKKLIRLKINSDIIYFSLN